MYEFLGWKESLTFAVALFGAVLGVMNTWNAISQRRVRLRVRPSFAITAQTGEIAYAIEVINLSAFAVTVTEVGFKTDGSKRILVTNPVFLDGGAWPRRLEARQSVSAYFDLSAVIAPKQPIGKAYARTACGEMRFGTSSSLSQLRDMARRA